MHTFSFFLFLFFYDFFLHLFILFAHFFKLPTMGNHWVFADNLASSVQTTINCNPLLANKVSKHCEWIITNKFELRYLVIKIKCLSFLNSVVTKVVTKKTLFSLLRATWNFFLWVLVVNTIQKVSALAVHHSASKLSYQLSDHLFRITQITIF